MSQNPYYLTIQNFWEYLILTRSDLPTIQFMMTEQMKRYLHRGQSQQSLTDLTNADHGLRWMVLAMHRLEDLKAAFFTIFGDAQIMTMYAMHDSYIWQFKK